MKNALIGYTGFVGSNLKEQLHFQNLYNSKNFETMKGQKYEMLICAGVSAVKWMANKEPETDRQKIQVLGNVLKTIQCKNFLLISTIDVYPVTEFMNENFDCGSYENHAYGKNRLEFEKFCMNQFPDCTIIRLPGLFGKGLKKNIIYDLLNDNCLSTINVNSSFQYYDLKNLRVDIEKVIEKKLKLVNLFSEPIITQEIIDKYFPGKKVGDKAGNEAHYNLYTRYAEHWGKKGNYIYSKDEVLQQMGDFISDYSAGEI